MYRIILISVSTLVIFCACLPARTPRIYNVLISTKKNLSPSHALPVYEPVLRTTSLSYAFPQILYNTPFGGIPTIGNTQYLPGPAVFPGNDRNPADGNYQPSDFIGAGVSRLPQDVKSPSTLQEENSKVYKNLQQTDPATQPFPVEHFIPYSPLLRNYAPYLPKELQDPGQSMNNQPPNVDQPPQNINNQLQFNEVNDPKQVIANLRKNSEIPDVPPPPLPVKTT